MARLALYLFGSPRLELDGEAVEINRRKALALLAYLAVTGQEHSRDTLATLLWPEYDQTHARAALRRTLSPLNQLLVGWLEIDRETVSLRRDNGFWLDVMEFQRLLAAGPRSAGDGGVGSVDGLAQAVEWYRDDFLAGFTLPDSADFDEWQFFQREGLRRDLAGALERLVSYYAAREAFEPAIAYARRWLRLDSLHEPAQRQLMRLYALSGQRAAALRQYDECRRVLEEELGLPPSAETRALYQQIQAGELSPGGLPVTPPPTPAPSSLAPAGANDRQVRVGQAEGRAGPVAGRTGEAPLLARTPLPAGPGVPVAEPAGNIFVAREQELAHLHRFLNAVLAGRGQVALVEGEAGSGKTALVREFVRRAQAAHPELMVATGFCQAYTGLGDPYLPFRQVLELLTGGLAAGPLSGAISLEAVRRLRQLGPAAGQAPVEYSPSLVISPVAGPVITPGLSRESRPRQDLEDSAGAPQQDLFEQFTQVLLALARLQPLILILEDFQWADAASINLLFHLGRRLDSSQILLLVTYRPADVALGRTGERHPLEPVLNELKRYYGDIEVDLGQALGRRFVDALVDTEPNELGAEFRAALYRRTRGHPLFTVELLRAMQARGDIRRNEQERWIVGPALDWRTLPARVEAVIAERLDRLEPALRDMLAVASVEGEVFTAQVIARVQQLPERQVLRLLSQELDKRHYLVREEGEFDGGSQRLSRYRFSHGLFQQYLYAELSTGERRLLHREVAAALAEFYAGKTGEVAVQLAHHYGEAGQGSLAVPYLLQVGDRARDVYALQEAIDSYQQALAFLKEQGPAGYDQSIRTLMKLGLTHHLSFDFRQAHRSFEEAFAMRQWAAAHQPAELPPAPHALRLFTPLMPTTLDPTMAIDLDSVRVIDQLFSGLVRLNADMDVEPELAARWEVRAGGREYVFHLRDNARWSNGQPVTAADFVAAWRRVLNPATRSPAAGLLYDIKGARAYAEGRLVDPAQVGVRALDEATLLIELEEPASYFPYLLTNCTTYPLPSQLVAAHGSAPIQVEDIVTNGPFCLESWQPGWGLTCRRNPNFWDTYSGNVERVELKLVQDGLDQLRLYEADELDVLHLSHLPIEEREAALQRHAGEAVFGPALDTTYLGFDTTRPPFNDGRVRRALVMATDRETLVGRVMGGYATPAQGGFIPPGMPGHSLGIGLPYDPAQARRLLAGAGYPDGRNFPTVEWLTKPGHKRIAAYLQAQWRQNLGVELQWTDTPWTGLLERVYGNPPQLFHMTWSADYLDPDTFLRTDALGSWTNWQNETYTRLINQARQTLNPVGRLELYRQADRLVVEEAAILPLFYRGRHLLIKPWITQFPLSLIKVWFWRDTVIRPH